LIRLFKVLDMIIRAGLPNGV